MIGDPKNDDVNNINDQIQLKVLEESVKNTINVPSNNTN